MSLSDCGSQQAAVVWPMCGAGPRARRARPGFFPVLGAAEGKTVAVSGMKVGVPRDPARLGALGELGTDPHSEGFCFLLFFVFLVSTSAS